MEATLNNYYKEAMKNAGLEKAESPMIKKIISDILEQFIGEIEMYKTNWDNAEARILELEHLIPEKIE
tara:strand:+ start:880 stop:1083 length:204 start_codon:yes stop_codon:yes gene_type:complete